MKFIAFFVFLLSVFLPRSVYAQNNPTTVAVFVREGCGHCKDEEVFLSKLHKERDDIALIYYRLENPKERTLWEEFTTRLGISKVTPITVVGDAYIVGFDTEQTTGEHIKKLIGKAQRVGVVTDIQNRNLTEGGQTTSTCPDDGSVPCTVDSNPAYVVSLPFVGSIDANKYPLVVLSALLGFFDGFNPCAMWVLVTFLVILLQVGNRRKMFLFAGTFILAEAIMYGFILSVWYKTWDFVRLDTIVTPIIGVVSIVGGVLFLREWRKKELECKVTDIHHRANIHQKVQKLATDKFTVFTLLGILGIAFSVNIIEFACSIGIPQAFTKIIELNALGRLQTAFLLAIYILFYMLDDFVVFGLALYGADKLALTTRYSKLSNLAGGMVMIILGILLIFNVHVLLF